jgi:hypothetical protein
MADQAVKLHIPPTLAASLRATLDPAAKVEVEVRCHVVDDEVAHRKLTIANERVARELWRDMDSTSREALKSLVSEALTEMAKSPETWLDSALTAVGNQSIGISVLFRLGSVDDQVLLLKQRRDAELNFQIQDLQRMSSGTHQAAG